MPRTLVARRQLLLGLGVTTLTAQWPRVARGQQSPIRIAAVPFETTAEPFYARDQGFFAKAGVDVTFDGFSSNGAAIIAAVLGGSMDIGVSNIVSLASAHARGIPLTIVVGAGVQSAQQPTDALLVPMGSSIRTGKDLDGKTIACGGLNTIAQYGCQAWIDKTGGQSTRSKFVEMTSPAIIAALSESRIDAAMLTEPFIAEGKKTARIIGYPMVEAISPRFMVSAFFSTVEWGNAPRRTILDLPTVVEGALPHREMIRRFQAAMRETAQWANANPAKTAAILAGVSRIPLATILASNRTQYPETVDVALLQPVIDVAAKYGSMKSFAAQELIFRE
jgi:NitT/TauT family transport system substrate-binding protein